MNPLAVPIEHLEGRDVVLIQNGEALGEN